MGDEVFAPGVRHMPQIDRLRLGNFPTNVAPATSHWREATIGFWPSRMGLMGGVEGFSPFVLLWESEALTGFLQVVDQLMAANIKDLGQGRQGP